MTRARLNNLVQGVAVGYSKILEIHGLGFRAEIAGQKLTLALGKSHPVIFEAPKGVTITVDAKKTLLTVSGVSKDAVGEPPPRTSASCASPSPTRERASAIRANTSARRLARPRPAPAPGREARSKP